MTPTNRIVLLIALTGIGLSACGGGGGTSDGTPVATAFTVSANVSGLSGAGLVLRNNGSDSLTIAINGTSTFATSLANGTAYAVTIDTQPTTPSQTCTVTNGSGTIASANIVNVAINCVTNNRTVSATVSGLAGSGLSLRNGVDSLAVAANGVVTFASAVASGTAYAITVGMQPTGPAQTCTVTNGSGTIANANIINVVVACVTNTYTVSATVSGLAGTGLLLGNSDGSTLLVTANGTATFANALTSGFGYAVTVQTRPTTPTQTCAVTNGTGTIANANVVNVAVTCITNTYTVSGTVTGLTGTGMILTNNGADNFAAVGSGAFAFATAIASANSYNVAVATQPTNPAQTCTVANGENTITSANVTNVAITCTTNRYAIGGTVSGLVGTGLVLHNNGGSDLGIAANGSFVLATPAPSNSAYEITVASIPSSPVQKCTVVNGVGNVTNAAITNVDIACVTQTPRFAYSLNYYGGSLSIYNQDAATGQLRMRGYAKAGQAPIMGIGNSTGSLAYVLNSGAALSPPSLPAQAATPSSISAYRHDNVTGDEKEISGSPFALTGTLNTLARLSIHPNDNFLYVTDGSGADLIWSFAINASGALTPLAGSPMSAGGTPSIVIFNAQGTFAYVTNRASNNISVYSVNTTSGVLSEILPRVAAGTTPTGLTLHPNQRFAYTANTGANSVSAYTVNRTTGALTPVTGSPYAIGPFPATDGVHFHPNGKFAYVRSVGQSGPPFAPSPSGSISAFAVNQSTGALTPLSGSPYAIGVGSSGGLFGSIHPNGKFLYVPNRGTGSGLGSLGSISAFSIDSNTGILTPMAGIATLQPAPFSANVDPSGNFLYLASVESDQHYSYRISSTGALTPLPQGAIIRAGAQPISLNVYTSPTTTTPPVFTNKFAYVPNAGDHTISSYATNATTGALTTTGTTTAGGMTPKNVSTSQGSLFAVTANASSDTASAYAINPATGVLSLAGGAVATGTTPGPVAVDPSGRFAYVVNTLGSTVSAYFVNATTGALTANGVPTALSTPNPVAAAIDPTGRNLYVLNATHLQVFVVNAATGTLAPPPVAFGSSLTSLFAQGGGTHLAIDPKGKYLYVANTAAGGSIEVFRIDPYSGVSTYVTRTLSGLANVSIAIDPTSRFAYTANSTNSVAAYSLNQATGALLSVGTIGTPSPNIANALHVSTDYSGKFVYTVLADNSVVTYAITQTSGSLSLVVGGAAATGTTPGPITTVGEVE